MTAALRCWGYWPAGQSHGLTIAVVGATGAVGTVMLQCLKERGLDQGNEIILFATSRSAGRVIDGRTVRALEPGADLGGIDIALFSAGGGTSQGMGAALRRGGGDGDRQLLRVPARSRCAAGRLRGESTRVAGSPRADRKSELLDDAADGGARADPPRGGDRTPDRLDLPVCVRDRSEGARGARRRGTGGARRRAVARADDLSRPHCVQRDRCRRKLRRG